MNCVTVPGEGAFNVRRLTEAVADDRGTYKGTMLGTILGTMFVPQYLRLRMTQHIICMTLPPKLVRTNS